MQQPSGLVIEGTHTVDSMLLRMLCCTICIANTATVAAISIENDTTAKLVVIITREYQIYGGLVCKLVAT